MPPSMEQQQQQHRLPTIAESSYSLYNRENNNSSSSMQSIGLEDNDVLVSFDEDMMLLMMDNTSASTSKMKNHDLGCIEVYEYSSSTINYIDDDNNNNDDDDDDEKVDNDRNNVNSDGDNTKGKRNRKQRIFCLPASYTDMDYHDQEMMPTLVLVDEDDDDEEEDDRRSSEINDARRSSISFIVDGDDDDDDDERGHIGEDEGIEMPSDSVGTTFFDNVLFACGGLEACGTMSACKPFAAGQTQSILKDPNNPHHGGNRNVKFSSLDIKEFRMTLGDHPSATSGPPVMLGAVPMAERTVSLDEYENERCPRRRRRQLKLSYKDRKGILEKQAGFTTQEVNEAWAEALKIRQQRHETLKRGLVLMTVDDAWESAQRKYRRLGASIGLL